MAYILGEIPPAMQAIREKSANVLDAYPPLSRSTWRQMKACFCKGDLRHCISDLIGEERKDDADLGGDCVEWTQDAADAEDLRLVDGVFAVERRIRTQADKAISASVWRTLGSLNGPEPEAPPARIPAVPLRIFVRGPPSSGKTTLCNTLAKKFQLHVLSGESIVNKMLREASNVLDTNANDSDDAVDDGDEGTILSAAKCILENLRNGLKDAAQIEVEDEHGDERVNAELKCKKEALHAIIELRQSHAVTKLLASRVRSLASYPSILIKYSCYINEGKENYQSSARHLRRICCRCRSGFT